LQDFFDELGDHNASIRAVSIDMNGGYEKAIRAAVPDAQICFDPFPRGATRRTRGGRRAPWRVEPGRQA
jgi:transposase